MQTSCMHTCAKRLWGWGSMADIRSLLTKLQEVILVVHMMLEAAKRSKSKPQNCRWGAASPRALASPASARQGSAPPDHGPTLPLGTAGHGFPAEAEVRPNTTQSKNASQVNPKVLKGHTSQGRAPNPWNPILFFSVLRPHSGRKA